jgi:hypothetical protein
LLEINKSNIPEKGAIYLDNMNSVFITHWLRKKLNIESRKHFYLRGNERKHFRFHWKPLKQYLEEISSPEHLY